MSETLKFIVFLLIVLVGTSPSIVALLTLNAWYLFALFISVPTAFKLIDKYLDL